MPRLLSRIWLPTAVFVLLASMAFAMVSTAVRQSPTIDEPVYVATAEVLTQQHSLRYNPEHPPLGKLVIAAGLAFGQPRLDPGFAGDQSQLGRHFLYESGQNPGRLMLLARIPMIVLTLAIGLVVFFFARDLAGKWGGLTALALYAFSPDVIAHGSLATLDVPASGMLLTAFWLLWRGRSRFVYVPLAGVLLGAAAATRMNTLPALLIAALLVGVFSDFAWRRRLLAIASMIVVAVAVVWVVYLAVDPRLRWSTPVGLHHPGGLREWVVDALPFPAAYRDGILLQFQFEEGTYRGFLLGHAYVGSPWYYLPTAEVIKTPLGMLVLWAGGSVTMLVKRALRPAAAYVIAPAAVFFLLAMTGARDYGTRYAIFMPMFLSVAAGTVVLVRLRWARVVAAGLVLFVAGSSVATYPNYLPYSNEAFGGTPNTHNNLHDANVDWGQDLPRLATRLKDTYGGQPVWLVYKGAGVPAYYGIAGRNPLSVPADQVHGLLVVSDSSVALASGPLRQLITTATPIDEVGYSITIYRR